MITRNTDYSIQRLRGLSTDTKPTDVPNGSEFREMDTGKKFLYSAAGTEWIEQPKKGGGGGGDNRFVVTCTPTAQDYSGTMDKTAMQILEAYNSGKEIWFGIGGAVFVPSAMVDRTANGKVFCAYAIMTRNNILIVMRTTTDTNNPLNNTYSTTIYQLTPMGG